MDPKTNGEQPAFGDSTTHAHQHGLTKREHFAAMAMQGFLSDWGEGAFNRNICASLAVAHADALLNALAAGGEG